MMTKLTIKNIQKYIKPGIFFLLLTLLMNCTADPIPGEKGQLSGTSRIHLSLSVGTMVTRSGETTENTIESFSVFVFEKEAGTYKFVSEADANKKENDQYEIELEMTDTPVLLYLIANSGGNLPTLLAGETLEEAKQKHVLSFDGTAFTSLPMYGEVRFDTGIHEESLNPEVKLLRSVATVQIKLTDEALQNFEFTGAYLMRANDKLQVAYGEAGTDYEVAGNKIKAIRPVIPESSSSISPATLYEATDNVCTFYLPESEGYTDGNDQTTKATCIVIAGKYNGTETFYRIDIRNQGNTIYGELLRNHRYIATISQIMDAGKASPTEAANSAAAGTGGDVIVVDEDQSGIIWGPDGYYFAMENNVIRVNYFKGAKKVITIETNVDVTDPDLYYIQWVDEDNNIQPQQGDLFRKIHIGSGPVEGKHFTLEVTDAGLSITAKSTLENTGSELLKEKALITAGPIQLIITVMQELDSEHIKDYIGIFNLLGGYGNLGDDMFGRPNPGVVSTPLREFFLNKSLFSPTGILKFGGFLIGGLPTQTVLYKELIEAFDVILLPEGLADDLTQSDQNTILDWHNRSQRRVLMAYTQNERFMEDLGVYIKLTPDPGSWEADIVVLTSVTVSPDAPDFICNGPLGTAPRNMSFNITDSASPKIPLNDNPDITPILIGNSAGKDYIFIGVDVKRRIIYFTGSYFWIYSTVFSPGITTIPTNPADVIISNIMAWIAETVIGEELAPDIMDN